MSSSSPTRYFPGHLLTALCILNGISVTSASASTAFETQVGLGYDSNVYRAPIDGSYTDYSLQPAKPAVPVNSSIQKGSFIPVKQSAEFSNLTSATGRLSTDLDFSGKFYTSADFSNANEYKYKFRIGYSELFDAAKSKAHALYGGLSLGHVQSLYLDRDTGDEHTYSDTKPIDISERYIYDSVGIEVAYENELAPIQHGVKLKKERRDYRDVPNINESQYDHAYFLLSGDVAFKLFRDTKLSANYDYYTYDYDERKSRDLAGNLASGNPPRYYAYNVYGITLRQRVSDPLVLHLDYELKQREDDFLGYHNYQKNFYKLRLHYTISKRIESKFAAWVWQREYAKAFAYDIESAVGIENGGKKLDYDGIGYSININFEYAKHNNIEFEYKYTDDNSTDFRYDYERGMATINYILTY